MGGALGSSAQARPQLDHGQRQLLVVGAGSGHHCQAERVVGDRGYAHASAPCL
jgi:hypothetical protein